MKPYGFTQRTAQRILEMERRNRQTGISGPGSSMAGMRNQPLQVSLWVAKCQTEISARSSTTAGSGTARLIELDGSTLTEYINNAGSTQDVTVNNYTDSVIAVGEYFTVTRDLRSTLWVVKAGEGGGTSYNNWIGLVTEIGGIDAYDSISDTYSSGEITLREFDETDEDIDATLTKIDAYNLSRYDMPSGTSVRVYEQTSDIGTVYTCERIGYGFFTGQPIVGENTPPIAFASASFSSISSGTATIIDGWTIDANGSDFLAADGSGVLSVPPGVYRLDFVNKSASSLAGTSSDVEVLSNTDGGTFAGATFESGLKSSTAYCPAAFQNFTNSSHTFIRASGTTKDYGFSFYVSRVSGSGTLSGNVTLTVTPCMQ